MDIALEQFLTDYNNGVFDAPSTSNQPETNQPQHYHGTQDRSSAHHQNRVHESK